MHSHTNIQFVEFTSQQMLVESNLGKMDVQRTWQDSERR